MQSGERVIGNFGAGIGYLADKGGLTRVGHTKQADIGQQFQLKPDFALFAGFARRELPRCAVSAGLEMHIAQPAFAALRDRNLLPMVRRVKQQLAGFGRK